jgi:hypothetical protein
MGQEEEAKQKKIDFHGYQVNYYYYNNDLITVEVK